MEQNPRTPIQSGRRLFPRWIAPLRLWMAALGLLATMASAQQPLGSVSDAAGTLKVTVDSLFNGIPPHGFLPLRVTIENDTGRAVSLSFETSSKDNRYFRGENSATASFRLGAEAGQTAEHEILAPLVPNFIANSRYGYGAGGSVSVRVSGGGLAARQLASHSDLMGNIPCVALSTESQRLNWDDVRNQLEAARVGASSGGGSGTFGARFAPERLPASWRGFSGFDAIVFRGDEWGKVAPTARAAVLDWVRMGGRIVFWGDDDKTPELAGLGFDVTGKQSGEVNLGLGSVVATVGKEKNSGNNLIGTVELLGKGQAPSFINVVSNDYTSDETGNRWSLQEWMGIRTFNSGQVIMILIAFGVIVGPVNLFILAKPGRRHRLFITTPIISVVASLLIATLIFIQDGFGGKGLRASVTFIDSGAKKSYATQEQIARTGVLLGRSYTVEEPLVITPVVLDESRWTFVNGGFNGTNLGFEMADKTLSGDWFRSRSEQGHLAQRVMQTRESVQVLAAESGPDGPPVVLSTIAYPLSRLVYIDDKGAVWSGENIVTGEKATLSSWDSGAFTEWWKESLQDFGSSVRFSIERVSKANFPGRFYAVASENAQQPMIDTLSSIHWKDKPALVFGLTETIGKGGPPVP